MLAEELKTQSNVMGLVTEFLKNAKCIFSLKLVNRSRVLLHLCIVTWAKIA